MKTAIQRPARTILFSADMVRALLAGRKSQTRRIVNTQPKHCAVAYCDDSWIWKGHHTGIDALLRLMELESPFGKVGDRLWVKENTWMFCEKVPNGKTKTGRQKFKYVPLRSAGLFYCADHPGKPQIDVVHADTGNEWLWRKKIGRFVPRWALRIGLQITGIRVERLQDISEEDAIAEGCEMDGKFPKEQPDKSGIGGIGWDDAREWYAWLWEEINGEGSWDKNPWVWVVEFQTPEDEK